MKDLATICSSLDSIKAETLEVIENLLNEKMTTPSLNLYYYQTNDDVPRYIFLDIDKDGYGRGIIIDTIEKVGKRYAFNMINEDEDEWGVNYLEDFNAVELSWILEMLTETFEVIEEWHEGKILEKGEFDYED